MKDEKILRRERIDKALENLLDYPLTIVSATMGYGKTTAVRSYLNSCRVLTAWVSLLGSDGSEVLFWHKLSAAFARLYPEIGKQIGLLGFPLDALQVATVMDLIQEMAEDKTIVLVIDDYHIIEQNKQVGNLLELIVQNEIPGLHIVLISRTHPKLNRIHLISKGLCYDLNTDALAFTLQEVKDYFDFMGFQIPPEDIEKIHGYTRGWISAIYLMLLGLKQGLPVTEVSDINQLVEDNFFTALDRQVQDTLLSLAVLDSFTLPQAVTVLENPQIPQIIAGLVELNAFIEFDRQTGVYKLHHVLLNFLREKQARNSIDLRDLCHRAGQWYFDHGDILSAFDYYYRAGEIEKLLKRLNYMGNLDISYLGFELQYEICAALPRDICIKYPFPFLHIASNFIVSGIREAAEQGRDILSLMRKYFEQADEIPNSLRNRILGEIEVVSIFLAFNDAEKMVEHAEKAYEFLEGGISCVLFRDNEFTFGLPQILYAYYREPGKLKDTVDFLQKSENFPPVVLDGCGTGCKYITLAEYALETGDMVNAEIFAHKAIHQAKPMMQTGIILCAYFTLMRLYLLQGRPAAAEKLLTQTREWLMQMRPELSPQNNAVYNTTMDLCTGYLYGCLKIPEMIPEWLRTGDMSSATFMFQGVAFPCIIYGKAVLLSADWVQLEILCEDFKEHFCFFHNQVGLLHNSIYHAVAKAHLYGMEAGIAALLPALKAAQTDGVMLPFIENADFILPILYALGSENNLDSSYLERLIQFSEQYAHTLKTSQPRSNLLTARETQVLGLLSQGLTQREIAGRLYLSVSTVKRYLENIYQKLGAHNKITAMKKAEELNIL